MIDEVVSRSTLRLAKTLQKFLLTHCAHAIIAVAHDLLPANVNAQLLMNCKDLSDYEYDAETLETTRASLALPKDALVLVYIGSLGEHRGLDTLLAVFQRHALEDVYLLLGGYGVGGEQTAEIAKAIQNVRYLGAVPFAKVPLYTAMGDVIVCLFNPAKRSHQVALPNKLFEALAAGKPIIVAEGTRAAELVEELGCGLVVPYGDIESLENAILGLKEKPHYRERLARNAKNAARERYNWARERQKLVALYRSIGIRKS
jgi:glycosyltransferase involved in cell wall biosynthesis